MDKPRGRTSIVGPILLIFVGVIFLFNNLGWVEWDIWTAAIRLWPLLLIIGGLDLIIGRRSNIGGVLVAVIGIALLVGGLWLFGENRTVSLDPARSVTINQELGGATTARVTIAPGAARLSLTGGASSGMLVEGGVQPLRGERVEPLFSVQERRATFELASQGNGGRVAIPGVMANEGVWELALNSEIPTDLTVSTGVGEANLELSRMVLTSLTVDTGVGRTEVTLPRSGSYNVAINGGVGSLTVWTPRQVGVRLVANTGIGGLTVPDSYQQRGDAYESPNYQSAEERVTLVVDGGIGNIRVGEQAAE